MRKRISETNKQKYIFDNTKSGMYKVFEDVQGGWKIFLKKKPRTRQSKHSMPTYWKITINKQPAAPDLDPRRANNFLNYMDRQFCFCYDRIGADNNVLDIKHWNNLFFCVKFLVIKEKTTPITFIVNSFLRKILVFVINF